MNFPKYKRRNTLYFLLLLSDLIEYYEPTTLFYTTRTGMESRRFFDAVNGELHPTHSSHGQRVLEYITGTSLPDALARSREAYIIDEKVQREHMEGGPYKGLPSNPYVP